MVPLILEMINAIMIETNAKMYAQMHAQLCSVLSEPTYHTPAKIFKAIEALDGIVENYLSDTYKERVATDYVLDFLKNCANFLIKLLTFGASQSFFDTTAGRLEQTKAHYKCLKSIYHKLTEAEQSVELLETSDEGLVTPGSEIEIHYRTVSL